MAGHVYPDHLRVGVGAIVIQGGKILLIRRGVSVITRKPAGNAPTGGTPCPRAAR